MRLDYFMDHVKSMLIQLPSMSMEELTDSYVRVIGLFANHDIRDDEFDKYMWTHAIVFINQHYNKHFDKLEGELK